MNNYKKKKYKPNRTLYSIRLEDAKVEELRKIYGSEKGITELINSLINERLQEGGFDKSKKITKPIGRIGGKSKISSKIVQMFPCHENYVDVFGGASHLLIEKDRGTSKREIFNDLDEGIYCLFREIKENPLELKQKLLDMPFGRKYYEEIKKKMYQINDPCERAAAEIYVTRFSFYSSSKNGYRGHKYNVPQIINNVANDIQVINDRFKQVELENLDFKNIIKKYDSETTFFYVDPPYLLKNGVVKNGINTLYNHKFLKKDMWELICLLKKIKGKFLFSHYKNEFIEGCFEEYNKVEIEVSKSMGKVDGSGKKPREIECLYYNYDI